MYTMLCKIFIPLLTISTMILHKSKIDAVSCPENGVYYQNLQICFWKLAIKRTAGTSNDVCKQEGGLLASIPDFNTLNFIIQNYGNVLEIGFDAFYGIWIGVKDDATEGQYRNYEGDIQAWTNWRFGDPNDDGSPIQDCVAMYPNDLVSPYSWQDRNCDDNKLALCFKKMVESTTRPDTSTSFEIKSTTYARTTDKTEGSFNATETSDTTSEINQDTIVSFTTYSDKNVSTMTSSETTTENIYVNTKYWKQNTSTSLATGDIATSVINVTTGGKTTPVPVTGFSVSSDTTAITKDSTSYCGCICGFKETMDSEDFKKILSELAIEKKNTSASRRKLISADDSRPSARNIGYLGASLLCVVLVFIVVLDLTSICMRQY